MKNPLNIIFFSCIFLAMCCRWSFAEKPGILFATARQQNWKEVNKLLNETSPSKEELNQVLGIAVVAENIEMIKLLYDTGADLNHLSSWETPLLINAIMHERFSAAEELINLGADINVRGYNRYEHNIYLSWDWTPLMCASRQGNLELAKLIVEKGADVNDLGWSQSFEIKENAADIAAYSGHLEILKFLLKKNVKLTEGTIHKAARGGYLEIIKYLLANKHDINEIDPLQGKTILMEAAWWGHLDIVKYLIDQNADVNKKGPFGHTAIGEAIRNDDKDLPNQFDIVKLLVENGADVSDSDTAYSMSPLQLAIERNQLEMVTLLEDHLN